jgi:hypothetical protein
LLPGRNLMRFGEPDGHDAEPVLAELDRNPWGRKSWRNFEGWAKSFVDARWHFILNQNGRVELFNWMQDPSERTDVSSYPAHAPTIENFQRKMAQITGSAATLARSDRRE